MRRGLVGVVVFVGACSLAPPDLPTPERMDLSPRTPGGAQAVVPLDASVVRPMYNELLAVDLQTVAKVAIARNLDVQQARQQVEAQRARLQSVAGWILPTLSPTLLYEQVDGTVRATQGNLVDAAFQTVQPYLLAQWFLNPGKVIYEIVAARKRMVASQYLERSTLLSTLHRAARQYYDLVLAQSHVAASRQAVAEVRELLRITQSRLNAGNALPGDELRAKAELAAREQDMLLAMRSFHDASISLAETLDLDPTVTLAPSASQVAQVTLVRVDTTVEELLTIAVQRRDDLVAVRTLMDASSAETSAAWWNALGPQLGAGYQFGGIAGHAENVAAVGGNRSGLHEQSRFTAGASFSLDFATLGHAAFASVAEQQAMLDAAQKLLSIRAQVVRADQDRRTLTDLMSHAQEQLAAAEEALRLAKANLAAGTMTVLDVLHDESSLAKARLRFAETVVKYDQAQIDLLAAVGILDSELFADAR